jgi:hypothetical protein
MLLRGGGVAGRVQLLLARSQCREDMRKLFKSMTKENVRKKRNTIGQLSHSQPLIVGEAMLDQVRAFWCLCQKEPRRPTCPLLPCPPCGAGCPRCFLLGARWT